MITNSLKWFDTTLSQSVAGMVNAASHNLSSYRMPGIVYVKPHLGHSRKCCKLLSCIFLDDFVPKMQRHSVKVRQRLADRF